MSDPLVETLWLGESELGETILGDPQFVITEAVESGVEGAPYLDPIKKDYATQNGTLLYASSTRQMIIVLVMTEFGTALGVTGTKLAKFHDETTERVNTSEVRRALQPLVEGERPYMRLDNISIEKEHNRVVGRLGIFIEFFDYLTGKPDKVEL
jgi:hypothetical protein